MNISYKDHGKPVDINGKEIKIGDIVYYARKADGTANGELVQREVTSFGILYAAFLETPVRMGKYTSTKPSTQIAILT